MHAGSTWRNKRVFAIWLGLIHWNQYHQFLNFHTSISNVDFLTSTSSICFINKSHNYEFSNQKSLSLLRMHTGYIGILWLGISPGVEKAFRRVRLRRILCLRDNIWIIFCKVDFLSFDSLGQTDFCSCKMDKYWDFTKTNGTYNHCKVAFHMSYIRLGF
jgi:hypothetical protein